MWALWKKAGGNLNFLCRAGSTGFSCGLFAGFLSRHLAKLYEVNLCTGWQFVFWDWGQLAFAQDFTIDDEGRH
jgi:hypothetical protein